jgi:hypothetical protein
MRDGNLMLQGIERYPFYPMLTLLFVLIIYPSQSREIPNREGIPCTFDDEGPDEAESFL